VVTYIQPHLIPQLSDEDLEQEIALGMKPSSWDKQLGSASPRESAASQSDQTNNPSKDVVMYIDQPDRAVDDPVAPSALKVVSDDVARRITEALERFTPEEWLEKHTAVSDEDFAKDPGRNRLAVLLSRTNHMSYHLEQIMLAHSGH
jgi:hypothetical protein